MLQASVQKLGDQITLLQGGVAAVFLDHSALLGVNFMENRLRKVLSQPVPLGGRPSQQILVDVEIIDEQGFAHPVDYHADRRVAEGELQQLFDVFPVRNDVNVRHHVDEIVGQLERGEAGL